jgi:plastocyanin
VAALVAALALTMAFAGGASASTGTECSWQRHSKRVAKQVRRHGRPHRVVRRKSWWSCDPAAAGAPVVEPPPLAAPTLAPSATPPAEPEPEPEANRLSVKAQEDYYVLSRPKVKAGELTVELNNQGGDPHNLNIRREGDEGDPLQIAETASLQRDTATFDLPPGTYRLWCSLLDHEEKGMHTTLVVE